MKDITFKTGGTMSVDEVVRLTEIANRLYEARAGIVSTDKARYFELMRKPAFRWNAGDEGDAVSITKRAKL